MTNTECTKEKLQALASILKLQNRSRDINSKLMAKIIKDFAEQQLKIDDGIINYMDGDKNNDTDSVHNLVPTFGWMNAVNKAMEVFMGTKLNGTEKFLFSIDGTPMAELPYYFDQAKTQMLKDLEIIFGGKVFSESMIAAHLNG